MRPCLVPSKSSNFWAPPRLSSPHRRSKICACCGFCQSCPELPAVCCGSGPCNSELSAAGPFCWPTLCSATAAIATEPFPTLFPEIMLFFSRQNGFSSDWWLRVGWLCQIHCGESFLGDLGVRRGFLINFTSVWFGCFCGRRSLPTLPFACGWVRLILLSLLSDFFLD